jgi:hypothetical protein
MMLLIIAPKQPWPAMCCMLWCDRREISCGWYRPSWALESLEPSRRSCSAKSSGSGQDKSHERSSSGEIWWIMKQYLYQFILYNKWLIIVNDDHGRIINKS